MAVKIKPCPFCGEKPYVQEWMINDHPQVKIFCNSDACDGFSVRPVVFGARNYMVKLWNMRKGEKK